MFNIGSSYVLLVRSGDDPGIIINRDLTDIVYLGNHPGFNLFAEANVLDALTFVQYSGDDDVYAVCTPGQLATVDVQRQNQNWSPSPAQAAASIAASGLALETTQQAQLTGIPNNIAATGVPLLSRSTNVINATNNTLPGGSSSTIANISGLTQTGYEIYIQADMATSATVPIMSVHLRWTDSTTGQFVGFDINDVVVCFTGQGLATVGTGPIKADTLQVILINRDPTITIHVNSFVLTMMSRPLLNDKWYSNPLTSNLDPTIPAYQTAWGTPQARVLFDLNRSVSNGITTSPPYILPTWFGPAQIMFGGAGTTGWFLSIQNLRTGTNYWQSNGNVTRVNEVLMFGRQALSMTFTNNNAGSQQMNCTIVAQDTS